MKNNKVFVVTADTYNDAWGAEISLFMVTHDKDKAEAECAKLEQKGYCPSITTTLLDASHEYSLGGYVE